MTPISVAVITFNEEKNIGRCLASVKDIADEIVVVDSFSKDKTREICESYGVRFIEHPFEGHIQQKNYALTQTSHKHVLSLDADEALSEQLKQSILAVKENWQADGYYFNRLTNYCGKWIRHSGWYPDRKVRLVNKEKGKWGGMNPHDRFIMVKDAKLEYLKGDLLHYSFYTIKQHVEQVNKFSDASAKALFEKGKRSNNLKIFIKGKARFFRNYFLKLGFLDGYFGYVICKISSFAVYLKYVKLKELQQTKSNA
jgi:glycosyltransferase involved in cell wall biosynthesis